MKTKLFFITTLVSFLLFSCAKKKGCTDIVSISYDPSAETDDGSCEYGGEGGQATIVIYPYSQGHVVISKASYLDSAYVKFNAVSVPGGGPIGGDPNGYDKIYTAAIGDSTLIIPGLKKGKYALYITCVDSLLTFNKRASRPIFIVIDQKDTTIVNRVALWPICCYF